jgi:hypothetical protein
MLQLIRLDQIRLCYQYAVCHRNLPDCLALPIQRYLSRTGIDRRYYTVQHNHCQENRSGAIWE